MPTSSRKKKQFRHHSRKKAQEAVWIVETRNNYFQETKILSDSKGNVQKYYEERYTDWKSVPEINIKDSVKKLFITPINTPMLPRTLEECVPIALHEDARWHLQDAHSVVMGHHHVYETRLRNTVTNDIIPVELFL